MNLCKTLQLPILAINLTAILLVLGKSIFDPNFAKAISFDFPSNVPLAEWQFLDSKPLKVDSQEGNVGSVFKAGRHYQYVQNNLPLTIEMRYVIRTQGQVDKFIRENSSIQLASKQFPQTIHQQSGIGFYLLFVYQKQAYLSSCINPHGGSTVSREQFKHNRDTYDPQLNRLLPVLLGREDWQDYRCLWTYMSIPLKNSSVEKTYYTLEKAWKSWYKWWSPHFPKL